MTPPRGPGIQTTYDRVNLSDLTVLATVIKYPADPSLQNKAHVYFNTLGFQRYVNVPYNLTTASGMPIKPGDTLVVQLSSQNNWKSPQVTAAFSPQNESEIINRLKRGLTSRDVRPETLAYGNGSTQHLEIGKTSKSLNKVYVDDICSLRVNNQYLQLFGNNLSSQSKHVIVSANVEPRDSDKQAAQHAVENNRIAVNNLRKELIIKDVNNINYLLNEDGTINVNIFRKDANYNLFKDSEVEEIYTKIYGEVATKNNKELQDYLTRLREVTKCMEDTAKESKKKTKTFLKQLIDGLVDELVLGVAKSFVLGAINSLLPDYLKVDIKIGRDENGDIFVSQFSFGEIVYNVKTDTVTVGGNIFNPFINSSINEVNKLLPPFLQVSASELGLEVGSVVIRKDELEADTQKEYRVREDIIVINSNATTYIQMRGQRFNLGRATDIYVDRSIRYGLDELNKVLPDLFYVSVRMEDNNVRVFDSGPFSITTSGKNAGLYVDQERLKKTIEALPGQLLNQVPAPLQSTARALWSQASKYIVDDILYRKATEARKKQEQKEKEAVEDYIKRYDSLQDDKKLLEIRKERYERDKNRLLSDQQDLVFYKQYLSTEKLTPAKQKEEEDYIKDEQTRIDNENTELQKVKSSLDLEEQRIISEENSLQQLRSTLSQDKLNAKQSELAESRRTLAVIYDSCVGKLQPSIPPTNNIIENKELQRIA